MIRCVVWASTINVWVGKMRRANRRELTLWEMIGKVHRHMVVGMAAVTVSPNSAMK